VITFDLNGAQVQVPDESGSLLDALRDHLGVVSAKDGCAPQGQCGCCTVWVDDEPRVSCVTPIKRVSGRSVTTLEGLGPALPEWAAAFVACGATQCGFCTPGIVMRLEALRRRGTLLDPDAADRGLAAHLCRCTGWQTIGEAAACIATGTTPSLGDRDLNQAAIRATIEGGVPQVVGEQVVAGFVGFADDQVPAFGSSRSTVSTLVAMLDADGQWRTAPTVAETRVVIGAVQGRRTTVAVTPPLALPDGDWAVTLATSWVEPGYLEPDSSTAQPSGPPSSPVNNGGAFGAKSNSPLPAAAARLAAELSVPIRARWRREDVVRLGPKRPPMAIGLRADGTGVIRVVRTAGIADILAASAPELVIEEVEVPGPPTSVAIRAAGWAELAVVRAGLATTTTGSGNDSSTDPDSCVTVTDPCGGRASARVDSSSGSPVIHVEVWAGQVLDHVVLRSYCIGAAHQALGWVTSEGLCVDDDGTVLDLTIRSHGILKASETPGIVVEIHAEDGPSIRGSDAVFAAVAAAVWNHQGRPPSWPTGRSLGSPS